MKLLRRWIRRMMWQHREYKLVYDGAYDQWFGERRLESRLRRKARRE